jgi:gas vesicle protein
MTGNLKGDMMPDLNTLSGKGNLLLLEGVLKKFAPLEKIASTLQIDELKSVSVKDIKNYIEFANGKVLVKPFMVKVKDIEMQIGGMHGLDQSLDYVIQMKVPRKYLGNEGNNLVNNLASHAAVKGIPVKLGDVVNLNIRMGGKLTEPTIKTELKEVAGDAIKDMQQQAVDFAKAKADTIKQTIKDTLTSVKKQVVADLKNEAMDRLQGNKDSAKTNTPEQTRKKTEETLKNTVNNFFNKRKSLPLTLRVNTNKNHCQLLAPILRST